MANKEAGVRGGRERSAERAKKAWELRKLGFSLSSIAQQLGVDPSSVSKYLKATVTQLRELSLQDAEDFRQMELERLDHAQHILAPLLQKGDLKAMDRYLRISDQRCKLLKLYAPVTEQATVTLNQLIDPAISEDPERLDKRIQELIKRRSESNGIE